MKNKFIPYIKQIMDEYVLEEAINAGCGKDISVNDLSMLIAKDKNKIKHVPHHHPQSEIRNCSAIIQRQENCLDRSRK